jgi:hypothetical protein
MAVGKTLRSGHVAHERARSGRFSQRIAAYESQQQQVKATATYGGRRPYTWHSRRRHGNSRGFAHWQPVADSDSLCAGGADFDKPEKLQQVPFATDDREACAPQAASEEREDDSEEEEEDIIKVAPHGLTGLAPASSSSSPSSSPLPTPGAGDNVNEGTQPADKDQDNSSCQPTPQAAPSFTCTVAATEDYIVNGVSIALTHMASLPLTAQPERLTCFHSKFAPNISIADFLSRLRKFFRCSVECHVLSLIYIDRLLKIHPDFMLSNLSCHRMIIASTVLAAKFHDDKFYSNKQYAKVGGVSLAEMNRLEGNFLKLIEWKLLVSQEEYDQYLDIILKAAAQVAGQES